MYAIVSYVNYRKEQSFEILNMSSNEEYAKQLAYYYAMKLAEKNQEYYIKHNSKQIIKILKDDYDSEIHLKPINKMIVKYSLIDVIKLTKEEYLECDVDVDEITDDYIDKNPLYEIHGYYSDIYCVLKINDTNNNIPLEENNLEYLQNIFEKNIITNKNISNNY